MNTISRWSTRVCRTRRNPIQHPHSVSLSRGRSDSHNPTHCRPYIRSHDSHRASARSEWLQSRVPVCSQDHIPLLTPHALATNGGHQALAPPGRADAAATHPPWDAVTRSLLATPITNAYIPVQSHSSGCMLQPRIPAIISPTTKYGLVSWEARGDEPHRRLGQLLLHHIFPRRDDTRGSTPGQSGIISLE